MTKTNKNGSPNRGETEKPNSDLTSIKSNYNPINLPMSVTEGCVTISDDVYICARGTHPRFPPIENQNFLIAREKVHVPCFEIYDDERHSLSVCAPDKDTAHHTLIDMAERFVKILPNRG